MFGELCKTGGHPTVQVAPPRQAVFVPLFGELCKTVYSHLPNTCQMVFSSPCSGNYVKRAAVERAKRASWTFSSPCSGNYVKQLSLKAAYLLLSAWHLRSGLLFHQNQVVILFLKASEPSRYMVRSGLSRKR